MSSHATITHKQPLKKDMASELEGEYDSSSSLSIPKSYEENLHHLKDAIMDESKDSIFPGLETMRPVSTYMPQPDHITDHISLALLFHAKVPKPLPTVSMTRALDKK